MVAVAGEKDLEVVLVAQIEAAVDGPGSVEDLQPPLLVELHADRMQRFFMALPLIGWRVKSEGERCKTSFWMMMKTGVKQQEQEI